MVATVCRELKIRYMGFENDRVVLKLRSVLNIFRTWPSMWKSGHAITELSSAPSSEALTLRFIR
jgi:hypothetical protein